MCIFVFKQNSIGTCFLLLLESNLLTVVFQCGGHRLRHRFLVLMLLLLQCRFDVELLTHSLLGQLTVQLVDTPVSVGNQGIQIIRTQLACFRREENMGGRKTYSTQSAQTTAGHKNGEHTIKRVDDE